MRSEVIAFTHQGRPRATSNVDVPPVPSLIDNYVLCYDEALERIVYVCVPDGEAKVRVYGFDGGTWSKLSKNAFEPPGERISGGGYDSTRRGVVIWGFDSDDTLAGATVTPEGRSAIKMRGDLPQIATEGGNGDSSDSKAVFVFDRAREVWVCLTRAGIWELSKDGAWSQKSEAGSIPKRWKEPIGGGGDAAVGGYDPVHQRSVFFIQTSVQVSVKKGATSRSGPSYPTVSFSWDGTELVELQTTGLLEAGDLKTWRAEWGVERIQPELCFKGNPCAQIASHARNGLVLHVGAGQMFVPKDRSCTKWEPLPGGDQAPPRMGGSALVHDPKRDVLVLGPGRHQGAGGSDRNDVFYVLRAGKWERQGEVIVYSPLQAASYQNCRMAHVGGAWLATGSHSLRTWKWIDEEWKEIVDEPTGRKIGGWETLWLVAGDRLYAVMSSGAVFALDGDHWTAVCKKNPAFKNRADFALAADANGRLVVWGGEANGRKLNDTLVLERERKGWRWRVVKKASPQPADFKHGNKDGLYVGTTMVFDTTIGALVRFGYESVFVLQDDETWKPYVPKGYKSLISERAWGHVPVHDPATGETLLVDFVGGDVQQVAAPQARIVRFDLSACAALGTLTFPAELSNAHDDELPYHALCETFSYDATTRSLHAQVLEDAAGTYRLDLANAFARGKALGARTAPKRSSAKQPSTSTFERTRLYRIAKGRAEVAVCDSGALVAAKRKAGFLPASELSRDALVQLAGLESQKIKVGKVVRSGAPPRSRLGGAPSGVTSATWPRVRRQPMGFLLQIETGARLRKHAGVAVFCACDGEATSGPRENAVVLLGAKDFATTCAAPAGVKPLQMHVLEIQPPKLEIDESRARILGASDPDLAAAFEQLASAKGMQEHNLADKLGGAPQFLQGDATMKGHTFVGQLDFDSLDVSDDWPDAGLSGCVYVFVRDDESAGVAFWQYT